tara:strand:+ start:1446 stop:1754 length:309 start_codon:yes stop_codon:yes gene_type:complete
MAENLRAQAKFPAFHVFTAQAATATQVKLPDSASKVTIGTTAATTVKVATDGGVDAAAPPANYAWATSGALLSLDLSKGLRRHSNIYIWVDAGPNLVHVILE